MAETLYRLPDGRMVTRAEYPHATPQQITANRAAAAARVAAASHMKGINAIGKQPTFGKRTQPPKSSRPMYADTSGSTCFDELVWEDGTVSATFTDGSTYDYDDFTRSEAREWFDDESLGGYFNDVVR